MGWAGFHAFRHTCATLLFGEGRNVVQVQRWLGHHSAAFTLGTYVHLLDEDLGAPLRICISVCTTSRRGLVLPRMGRPEPLAQGRSSI